MAEKSCPLQNEGKYIKRAETVRYRPSVHVAPLRDCDFDGDRIHICRNVQYSPDKGDLRTTPKTKTYDRWVSMPEETMKLLRKYNEQV